MIIVLFNIIISLIYLNPLLPEDVDKNNKGINKYNNKDYDEAIKNFSGIKNPKKDFNLGTSFYKKNDFEKAKQKFSESLILNDNKDKLNSLYNLGNTYFNLNDFDHALQSYQSALDLCAKDSNSVGKDYCKNLSEKIRNNIEFAFKQKNKDKKDEESKKENKDNKDNKDEDNKKDKENKKEDQNNKEKDKNSDKKDSKEDKNKDKKNEESKKENKDNKDNKEKDKNKEEKQNMAKPKGGKANIKKNISKRQAKQLLKIINESDKNIQKNMLKSLGNKKGEDTSSGKKW